MGGLNDVTIIGTIISIFIIVGTFLPFINESFGISPEDTACFKITELESELGNTTIQMGEKASVIEVASIGSLSFFDVVKSIVKMFFWTCGGLPLFIDLFFLVIRFVLLILLVRLIRSGGG